MRSRLTALALVLGSLPLSAHAQDMQPALDPAAIAQGQVIAGMARGHAERGGYREPGGATARTGIASDCAKLRRLAARGRTAPTLPRALAMCRAQGH